MKYRNTFWNFDGTIFDSIPISNIGFQDMLKDYPSELVRQLMEYQLRNRGLSRYVKFRYFQHDILNVPVNENQVQAWSATMRCELTGKSLIFHDSVRFIQYRNRKRNQNVVLGFDELNIVFVVHGIEILRFLKTIKGFPAPADLIRNLIKKFNYERENCRLIEDFHNNLYAAIANINIFLGNNNPDLKSSGYPYVERFSGFEVS